MQRVEGRHIIADPTISTLWHVVIDDRQGRDALLLSLLSDVSISLNICFSVTGLLFLLLHVSVCAFGLVINGDHVLIRGEMSRDNMRHETNNQTINETA